MNARQTPVRRPRRGSRIWIALVAVSLIAALPLLEAALRILPIGPRTYQARRFEPNGRVPFAQLANGLIVYQPNATFASVYDPAGDTRGYFGPEGRVTYRINALGMRGPMPEVPKPPNTFRIICLGDSFTFGEGVREEDTWPARLQSSLRAKTDHPHVECINAGVQAYGTPEAAQFFLLRCLRLDPDVVVLGFFLNDATEFAETIRQNEAQTKETPLSSLGRVSRIAEMIERHRLANRLQEAFFRTTRESFQSPQWQRCRDIIGGMQQLADDQNFRFIVMIFPILCDLDGDYPFEDIHATIRKDLQQTGCQMVDLLEVYRGRTAESLWVHPTDQHPNETAQRLAAERIADVLAPDIRTPAP